MAFQHLFVIPSSIWLKEQVDLKLLRGINVRKPSRKGLTYKNPSGFQLLLGSSFLLRKLESLHLKNGGSLVCCCFLVLWFVYAIMPQCLLMFTTFFQVMCWSCELQYWLFLMESDGRNPANRFFSAYHRGKRVDNKMNLMNLNVFLFEQLKSEQKYIKMRQSYGCVGSCPPATIISLVDLGIPDFET